MLRAAKDHATPLLIAVSLLGVLGCATAGDNLDGTRWKLTGWSLSSQKPDDFAISASFDAGKISGRSAVNQYSGSYTIGPGDGFETGLLASTRMAGPEPAMRAESAYLALLAKARSYKKSEGRLTLFDAGGNESLIFEAANP